MHPPSPGWGAAARQEKVSPNGDDGEKDCLPVSYLVVVFEGPLRSDATMGSLRPGFGKPIPPRY